MEGHEFEAKHGICLGTNYDARVRQPLDQLSLPRLDHRPRNRQSFRQRLTDDSATNRPNPDSENIVGMAFPLIT